MSHREQGKGDHWVNVITLRIFSLLSVDSDITLYTFDYSSNISVDREVLICLSSHKSTWLGGQGLAEWTHTALLKKIKITQYRLNLSLMLPSVCLSQACVSFSGLLSPRLYFKHRTSLCLQSFCSVSVTPDFSEE